MASTRSGLSAAGQLPGAPPRRRLAPGDRRRDLLRAAARLLTEHGVDAVQIGEFVEAKCRVVRRTRSLIFMSGEFMVGDRTVATANGVWKALGKP